VSDLAAALESVRDHLKPDGGFAMYNYYRENWLIDRLAGTGELAERRRRRLLDRTRDVVDRATRRWLWEETGAERHVAGRLDDVVEGRISPYEVAAEVVEGLKQGART